MERIKRTYQILTIVLFGCMLALPLLQLTFHWIPEKEVLSENRTLAPKPEIQWAQLDRFPSQYDNYLKDHFPFRKNFLDAYYGFSILNGESFIPSVIIGQDNFLFSGKEELSLYNGVSDYFADEEIDHVIQELSARQQALKKQGIALYVAIAPTAYEIYPELLPKYIQRVEHTATDHFIEALHKKAPKISCIYFKETLLKHKGKDLLYLKNDNHWNKLGAYYAADALLNRMSKDFPTLPSNLDDKFTFESIVTTEGNLAGWLNIGSRFDREWKARDVLVHLKDSLRYAIEKDTLQDYEPTPGFAYPWEYEQEYRTALKDRPKIVVIRDSYSNAIIPFLAPFFQHSLFIFDAWQYGANQDIIQNEQPDIVLYIIYEPHIRNIAR